MGGGDLNLKKSWHPSTMKNMEKVWKAEQKYDQEKKRIAELQREIREERAREDLHKFAEEKGVIEKKDNMKLDWMYKGPGGNVDREEYLLGRAIDKSFEQLEKCEKGSSSSATAKNNVDTCVPSSIFTGGNEQVDMARKLQEDPLYAIRKKEIESRSQILKNPVKLKQLRELIKEQKTRKQKKHKREKKKKKNHKRKTSSNDESSSDDDLDAVLLAKYKKLKDKLKSADIVKLKCGQAESSDSEEGRDAEEEVVRRIKSRTTVHSSSHYKRKHEKDQSCNGDSDDQRRNHKSYGLLKPSESKYQQFQHRTIPRKSRSKSPPKNKMVTKPQWVRPERKRLSEEELEQRRREMMANASWREKERKRNVARYKEEEKKEKKEDKEFNDDFMRKQLSRAAAQSSVERRIKSNIYNIQRSAVSMDKNFARR